MHELRLVAVSEDGSYAILAVPGRGGRFSLPIDDRLRTVARGQFSRLAQYEIEVESPLRPKEIQDRIRAGETAEEIADVAGVPIERVRRFEGPVLAERAYRAQGPAAYPHPVGTSHPLPPGPNRRLSPVLPGSLARPATDAGELPIQYAPGNQIGRLTEAPGSDLAEHGDHPAQDHRVIAEDRDMDGAVWYQPDVATGAL